MRIRLPTCSQQDITMILFHPVPFLVEVFLTTSPLKMAEIEPTLPLTQQREALFRLQGMPLLVEVCNCCPQKIKFKLRTS